MQSEAVQLPLTHRAWAWFETNRKQAMWGAIAVVAGAGLIAFLVWRHEDRAVVAGEALTAVTAPQLGGAPRPDAAQALLKVANDYPRTAAGARARLMAGGAFFTDGKYDEARAQFERFIRDNRESRFITQALLGLAACYDAQGKTNEAITAYKSLIDSHPGDNVLPQAKFSLASLYEGQGKLEMARSYFEEVGRDPYSSLGSEAGMRYEELIKQHPELVPKPAPAPVITPVVTPIPTPGTSAPAVQTPKP